MLRVGTEAPDFTATLDDGATFHLADHRGKENIVLYFYPRDFTPGCTKQACSFRDNYDEISKYDAMIVGVSADSAGQHGKFREQFNLPFPLITDAGRDLMEKYAARGMFSFLSPRITYVIDKQGIVRAAMRHDIQVTRHVDEVLEALRALPTS
jgi:thioredoxin-dependent peroxiredoxin